ncbi:NADPH-dependent F420 reductase [Micromonospora sp. CA-240977]|uniref:NADPH-dependent F420 reductase n=1 Tax=Micromonospora sp. CA-240977 TaxID=3239957 RepID=UPI003D8F4414
MTTIGFVGAGQMGSVIARLSVKAGYDVVVSNSRGPETLADLVAGLGPRARAATVTQTVAVADLIVVSVPFKAYRQVPFRDMAGKVVLDTSNYYADRDGNIPQLDSGSLTTAELQQQQMGRAHLVKVFNNIKHTHLESLARPAQAKDRTALTVAADDLNAKLAATAFLKKIGYDVVDVGSLADSWRVQPHQPATGTIYGSYTDPLGRPVSIGKVRMAVAAAQR